MTDYADLIAQLQKLYEAKKPAYGGPHGQQLGEEMWAIRANGYDMYVLLEAAAGIESLLAERDALRSLLGDCRHYLVSLESRLHHSPLRDGVHRLWNEIDRVLQTRGTPSGDATIDAAMQASTSAASAADRP